MFSKFIMFSLLLSNTEAAEGELGEQKAKKGAVQQQTLSALSDHDNTIGFTNSQPTDDFTKTESQNVTASPSDLVRTISAGANPTGTE